jgi:hypothetical protein
MVSVSWSVPVAWKATDPRMYTLRRCGVGDFLGGESGVGQDGQQGVADGLCVRSVEGVAEYEVYGAGVGE